MLAVALGLQVATLVRVVDASWAGDGLAGELGAMLAVGPWPSAVVLATGALTVAAAIGTARLLVAAPGVGTRSRAPTPVRRAPTDQPTLTTVPRFGIR